MNKLFVISGSSGVGKGTVIERFLERNPEFSLSVSCTTRAPRPGEVNGVNYFFLTRDEFEASINEFLEWAEFAGNLYGTKHENIRGGKIILEIDTQGALQVKEKMGADAVLIFIVPPSLEDLEARLRGRNTEDEAAIQNRLDFVKKELEFAKQFDYQITNDSVENAVAQLEEIICKKQF
jgi:guanylate kinase